MPLRLYNTLSQTKEPFQTVEPGKVGMYVCGPTVYSNSHIGHMVGPVIFDTIKRYLVYLGYEVTWVVNITDVDDKLIIQAQKDGTTVADLAGRVTDDYLRCLSSLGVDGIDHMPRATEHIGEIVAMTQGLIDKGFAYPSHGDVYFDVTKAPEYGKLSHRDPEALQAGSRIEPSTIKHHPGDFALWKGSKPGEPAWDSPWGPGRPGWHIECSAMSMKLLGNHFDIHGGGLDLVFPHHENEVVQSECFSGVPFATYWLHNGLLTKAGKKISKSDPGTLILMSDLLQQHDPDTLRCLFLASHYRRPIDYGPGRLDELARGPGSVPQPLRPVRAPDRRELRGARSPEAEARPGADSPIEGVDEHRDPLPRSDGRRLQHRRRPRRAVRAGPRPEPPRRRQKLESAADPAAIAAFRSGVVALKELAQILGLFRRPQPKRDPGSAG